MSHPYRSLPPSAFWKTSVAGIPAGELDPVVSPAFTIARTDRVVTAGSCFAQHIARHLALRGFTYHVTETPHPFFPAPMAREWNYGVFSARYGNLYTTRQLVQLVQRAYGEFTPAEGAWKRPDGAFADPFRPEISPVGYQNVAELEADRKHHLRCVRRALEEADVFVFTLGLTEAWRSKEDGAVFPLCPGVVAGTFDPARHEFVNFRTSEIVSDILYFRERLRQVNPRAKLLLTVSPVPLVATASGQHVLTATTASKAMLRAACAELQDWHGIAYFPSFEIITGAYARGRYFADDLRSVLDAGVEHVMRSFIRHYGAGAGQPAEAAAAPPVPAAAAPEPSRAEAVRALMDVVCEEEALQPDRQRAGA